MQQPWTGNLPMVFILGAPAILTAASLEPKSQNSQLIAGTIVRQDPSDSPVNTSPAHGHDSSLYPCRDGIMRPTR